MTSEAVIGVMLGSGREAEVYAWGENAVVKLYRPGFGGHRAEATVLAALDRNSVAPRLIDIIEYDGRTGLVLERLDGSDMLTLLQRQPWRILGLAQALGDAHLAVHAVAAPSDLPDLRQVLAVRIDDATLSSQLRTFALRILDRLPGGDRLCHGDYHPGNVLVGAGRVSVIDWVGATRGVAEADFARTLLLLRWADPLPGTPLVSRVLIAAGRAVLARRYARAYARGSRHALPQVQSWLAVHAAARLSEGIDVERATLVGLVERAQRTTSI